MWKKYFTQNPSPSSPFAICRDFGSLIKGLAIVLMVIHHFFGFPGRLVSGISYPDLLPYTKEIANSTKICVPIFAFLTGWVYYFHRDKSFKYSLKKISNFLICYWIDFLVLLILSVVFCSYHPTTKQILSDLFPFHKHPLMMHSWYVVFYVLTMIALPLCAKVLVNQSTKIGAFCCCLSFIFIVSLLNKNDFLNWMRVNYLYVWFPTVLAGYYFAKFKLFDRLYTQIHRLNTKLQISIGIMLIAMSLFLHAWNGYSQKINNGWILVPIFILGAYFVFRSTPKLNTVLMFFGKHSMNIWFLHCIFHSWVTREVFQPLAYFPQNPILVVILVLLVCSACSVVLTKFQGKLNAHVNKLIFDRK